MLAKSLATLALVFGGSVFIGYACGGDSSGCPGKVCSDCASSECNSAPCPSGQVEFCGHFGYFDDPNLRCSFCESEDFEP